VTFATAYVSYEQFYPEVMPYFPGMPEPLLLNAIRNACIEFCEKSDWLFYTPMMQDLQAGEDEYDLTLDLPPQTVISRVQSCWCNQQPVAPKSEEDLRAIYGLDWRNMQGNPCYITQYVPEILIIIPTPTIFVPQGLGVTLVIRPSVPSTTVDPSLLNHWHEVIAAGARGRLYATPGQAYENPKLAAQYMELFEAGVMRAQIQRRMGLTRAIMRVRPPRLVP
jgi:hypothetical protein